MREVRQDAGRLGCGRMVGWGAAGRLGCGRTVVVQQDGWGAARRRDGWVRQGWGAAGRLRCDWCGTKVVSIKILIAFFGVRRINLERWKLDADFTPYSN